MSSPFAQYLRPQMEPHIEITVSDVPAVIRQLRANGKPVLLDLFCGAGGCSVGYSRSGFNVISVDINPQPNLPGYFVQYDAFAFPLDGFDAIHASPKCQRYSVATPSNRRDSYPDQIPGMRERLIASGLPYIIENVVGAPLLSPVRLCGTMFGLGVVRHRLFEVNFPLPQPKCRDCYARVQRGLAITVVGQGCDGGSNNLPAWAKAMGIYWMTKPEITQAIPPAYTEWIGGRLLAHMWGETLIPT